MFLVAVGTIFGQQPSDLIYSNLDEFLEIPSPENLKKLELSIKNIKQTNKEVQLAKTIAYCNIGYMQAQNLALQKAIDSYEKAKQLYFSENLEDYDIIEYCLMPLGNLYLKVQAFSEAENTIKHYILFAKRRGQSKQELSGVLNLSVLYHNLGEFEKSKSILLQALEKESANQDLKLNLASVFFALNQRQETKNLLKDILSKDVQNFRAYQLFAQVYLSDKNYVAAILNVEKAIKILQNHSNINSRELARMHLSLAETCVVAKQLPKAIVELQKVYSQLIPSYDRMQEMPTSEQLYAESTLMDALDLHAHILSKEEKNNKALKVFEMASRVNDFLFVELSMQESKLIVQQNVKRRSEVIMELYYQQFQRTKNIVWIEKAVSLDSKVKGRIVWEAVYLKNILTSKNANNEKKFQDLNAEISLLANEIQRETKKYRLDAEAISSLQNSYSEALTKQRILYDSIQSYIIKDNEVSHSEIFKAVKQKAKKLNQSIVSYFMGDEAIYQFIISGENISFKKLTDSNNAYEDFRESIRNYNRFFDSPATINNDISAFSKASYSLFQKLNLPVSEKLIVIPDGILSFIPFQTLITESTESRQFSQMAFLIFRSSVSYLVSLKDFLNDDVAFQRKQSVLGFFPIFKDSEQELGYSVYEADAIHRMFPSQLLMESEATSKKFSEECQNHTILHFATHAMGGTFNEAASIQFFDRTLSLEEIYSYNIPADLVVLSACDTGIGKLVKGEGALSLARAFQYAGAGNVLFSLWQVNDKSTTDLMTYYYRNLKKSKSRDCALHKTHLDYLKDETINNAMKSPYYWGAFVYYGTTDFPLESQNMIWYFIVGGIFVAIVFFFFRRKIQNKYA